MNDWRFKVFESGHVRENSDMFSFLIFRGLKSLQILKFTRVFPQNVETWFFRD